MTHTTEQERAEFEARFKHLDLTQEPDAWGAPRYKHDAISLAWDAWQAARRAQVVPQGWKPMPCNPTIQMMCAAKPELNRREAYRAMFAAAPQPPEATINDSLTVEAAPVQMPEPVAAESRFTSFSGDRWRWCTVEHARAFGQDKGYEVRYLYTEHQVRQLLAAHGITQEKQG